MDEEVPPEIRNIIYGYLAEYRLQKLCLKWNIGYDQLTKFLQDNSAIIYGSALVSCFYSEIINFSEINIFIINKKYEVTNCIIDRLLQLFPHPEHVIGFCIGGGEDDILDYSRTLCHPGTPRINVLIGKYKYFPTFSHVLHHSSIITSMANAFTGIEWITLTEDLVQIMESKFTQIINPFAQENFPIFLDERCDHFPLIMRNLLQIDPSTIQQGWDELISPDSVNFVRNYVKIYDEFRQMSILADKKSTQCIIQHLEEIYNTIMAKIRLDNIERLGIYLGTKGINTIKTTLLFDNILTYMSYGFIFTNLSEVKNFLNIPNSRN